MPTKMIAANVCSICNSQLIDLTLRGEEAERAEAKREKIYKLNCGHQFHDFCIRGWVIVGKKDSCASCSEKVNLKEMFRSLPWERHSLAWNVILDLLRYLIVFNPMIMGMMQIALYIAY